MPRNIEIKRFDNKFEVKAIETKVIEKKDLVSMEELEARLESMRSRRAMDQKTFEEALAKKDAEIQELESIISSAKSLPDKGSETAMLAQGD